MYVAYDPQNLQHSYGQDASGLASEETQTMVDPAAGPEVAATGHSPAGLDAPARLMHRAKHAKHKKLARKWQILIAVMLIFCALTGGIIYLQSQFTFVPSVEGMARDDAKAALEKAELTMGIDHKEYSEEIPKGAVISQSPTGGKIQKKHTVIHLVISKGSNKVTVPDLIGRTADDARETIKSSHLKVNVETTSNILKKSGVVDQSPKAGSRVTRGTTVTITVNESTFRDQVDDWFGTGGDKDDGSVD
jgi:serine/threonine-protein kinase